MRLLTVALLSLGACSENSSESNQVDVGPISQVVMHRSGCYGPCPIYTVTINSDGKVTFEGKEYVAAKGIATWNIPIGEVAFLNKSIERIGFFGLKEAYRSKEDGCKGVWTDNPSVEIVASRGEAKKHVSYYYGCEGLVEGDRIDWLSKTIDDVAGTHRSLIQVER